MSLLFFVSGYLFPKGAGLNKKDAFNVVKKRFFSLFVPWIAGGIVYHYFRGLNVFVLWFLLSLFVFTIVNVLWEYIRINWRQTIYIDCLYYLFWVILFGGLISHEIKNYLQLNYGYYMMFSIGIIIRRQHLDILFEKQWVISINGIIFILINILKIKGIIIPLSTLITAISGTIFFWNIFKTVLTEGKFYDFLKTLGLYSLEIYILHGLFIIKIYTIGAFIMSLTGYMDDMMTRSTLELLIATAISIPVISLCLIFIKATKNNTIINFLFGKIKI